MHVEKVLTVLGDQSPCSVRVDCLLEGEWRHNIRVKVHILEPQAVVGTAHVQ